MLGHVEHFIRGQNTDFSSYETFCMDGYDAYFVHIVVHWDRSYSYQSSAKAQVWNLETLTWNTVAVLMPHEVTSEYDAASLLRSLAMVILWGEDPIGG